MDTAPPDPQELEAVETRLYNRMVRNAFVGFLKSAAIGAAIGLTVGALGAAVLGAGAIGMTAGSAALRVAAWLGGVAGSFGAVAGIQSTRDTRRFFLLHEGREASPEETTEQALVLPSLSHEAPRAAIPETTSRFRALLAEQDKRSSSSLVARQ